MEAPDSGGAFRLQDETGIVTKHIHLPRQNPNAFVFKLHDTDKCQDMWKENDNSYLN
jgi:hypothetical protein